MDSFDITKTILMQAIGIMFCYSVSSASGRNLEYSELINLNASCAPFDTCVEKKGDELYYLMGEKRCECDLFCYKRGTCCIDSPYVRLQLEGKDAPAGTCLPVLGSIFFAFMISSCDRRWDRDPDVKTLCEDQQVSFRDPIINAPVTNIKTQVTYKNYFCAICNNDYKDIILWNIMLKKRRSINDTILSETEVLNDLEFDEITGKWGLFSTDDANNTTFTPMSVQYSIPGQFRSMVRWCPNDLISNCASTWVEEETKQKCKAYFAEVYISTNTSTEPYDVAYRNIHCAICNYVTERNETLCHPTRRSFYDVTLQFTLLLDINMSKGQDVGKINSCPSGETYDPFFKKCRTLKCIIPGYVIRGKKCVRS